MKHDRILAAEPAPIPFPHECLPEAAAIARVLRRYQPGALAHFVMVAIDLLDVACGDPDLEDDDPSGQCDEDGINTDLTWQWGGGPGCSMSDEPEDDDPGGGNIEDEPHDGHDEGV